MRHKHREVIQGEDLYVGIDLHKRTWHITIRTTDLQVFSASIPGNWTALRKLLDHYKKAKLHAVYEAGYGVPPKKWTQS